MPDLTRRDMLKSAAFGAAALAAGPFARFVRADDTPAKKVTVTIYNTGDLHDHPGSLARIAGFVKAEKKKDPNTLFVDAGDICNKGKGYMAATGPVGMFHVMSLCSYDAAVLGNWDYTFGKDRVLEASGKHKGLPLVLCNMKWEGADVEKAAHIPRYKLYDFDGLKLCLSGGGSHYKNHYGSPAFPLHHERICYAEILPEVKKKSDVQVFVSHLFERSDGSLLAAWKDDSPAVMIGGHSHARLARRIGKTLLVKAGFHGNWLGKTVITYDPAAKTVQTSARIMGVSRDWPEDAEVAKVHKWYASGRPKKGASVVVPGALAAAV